MCTKKKKKNTELPMTVVTQFLTTDGTDLGDLKEIRRIYVQNGKVIQNSKISADKIPEAAGKDSITDEVCQAAKTAFVNHDDFTKKGSLAGMGASLKRGMVLVLSLWDDVLTKMNWLDSATPSKDGKRTAADPGVKRGPCTMTAGDPLQLRGQYPSAHVLYTNIMVGELGSTFTPEAQAKKKNPPPVTAPVPAASIPVQQPVQQPAQPVVQPVQPVPAVPAALQPMTPAEEVTGGTAVDGFCCFYGPNPGDLCANCQSKDTSPWNANPTNCDKSGGKYCSGIVRLFSTEKELPAVGAQMPLGARLIASGLGAACGLSVMALAFIRARRSRHGYAAVGESHQLLQATEIQDEEGSFVA